MGHKQQCGPNKILLLSFSKSALYIFLISYMTMNDFCYCVLLLIENCFLPIIGAEVVHLGGPKCSFCHFLNIHSIDFLDFLCGNRVPLIIKSSVSRFFSKSFYIQNWDKRVQDDMEMVFLSFLEVLEFLIFFWFFFDDRESWLPKGASYLFWQKVSINLKLWATMSKSLPLE